MKVKEFLTSFTESSVFELKGKLRPAYEIIDTYGDFEVVKVDASPNSMHPKLTLDEPTCDCYEVTEERYHLTEYEKGYYYGIRGERLNYITKEVSRCLGTKDRETCTCGGYKSRCNFYRDKFMKELEDDKDD